MRTLLALLLFLGPVTAARADDGLRVESDLFGLYGLRLMRDGNDVGPGFLTLGLADAVAGSELAVEHAHHARTWAFVNLGLAVTAAGLAAGSLATYADARGTLGGWPDLVPAENTPPTASILAVGMVVSLAAAIVARYATYEEITLSVSAFQSGL